MRTLQDRAVSCRYCDKTLAYGTSRQQQHLDQCQKYQVSLQETRKRKRNDSTAPITAFDQISPHEHNELDELAALMIYDAGLPLGFFEYPAVQSFFHRLRPAYNLPSRTRVSTTLLDDSYQAVKQEVEEYIDKQDNLCLSFDESNDVANNRIMNISVTTERGAFFVENIDLGAATVTAEYCTQLIEQRAQVITKGQLGHINSISTDTGGAMPKTARLLKALPSFQHTFMIPCDPHGLQLLIQDICKTLNKRGNFIGFVSYIINFLSACCNGMLTLPNSMPLKNDFNYWYLSICISRVYHLKCKFAICRIFKSPG